MVVQHLSVMLVENILELNRLVKDLGVLFLCISNLLARYVGYML